MENEKRPNIENNAEENPERLLYELFKIAKDKFRKMNKGRKANKTDAAECARYAFEKRGIAYEENFDRFNYFGEITHALRNGTEVPKPDLQQELFK